MCLTSNFALSFIADNRVLAAITLQPAVPPFSEGELHICPEDVSEIRDALDRKGAMYVLEFEEDP